MKTYAHPGGSTATVLVARSPAPRVSPTFVRPASSPSAPSSPDVASHIVEMLRRGPDRATALIQTLVAHRSTSGLVTALKRDPAVLDHQMLLTLIDCRATREFLLAVQLRPDLATAELVLDLAERQTKPSVVAAVEKASRGVASSVVTVDVSSAE